MITVEKLTKQFKGNQVLNGIDLRVETRASAAITAPSCSSFLMNSGSFIAADARVSPEGHKKFVQSEIEKIGRASCRERV